MFGLGNDASPRLQFTPPFLPPPLILLQLLLLSWAAPRVPSHGSSVLTAPSSYDILSQVPSSASRSSFSPIATAIIAALQIGAVETIDAGSSALRNEVGLLSDQLDSSNVSLPAFLLGGGATSGAFSA